MVSARRRDTWAKIEREMKGRNEPAEGQCRAVDDRRAKLELVDAAIAVC
jgi:hypothetical protein